MFPIPRFLTQDFRSPFLFPVPGSVLKRSTISAIFLLIACSTWAGELDYRSESRSEPRPLWIHILQFDLADKTHELAVAVGEDPDGDGPAESQMVDPKELASQVELVFAVNANAWSTLPPTQTGQAPQFVEGGASDVLGWVVADGVERSPVEKSVWSFWLDEDGVGHIGNLSEAVSARLAISGFAGLLSEGAILPKENPDSPLHPRTALGLDAQGRIVTLVVVDGRQPGFSEGMNEHELAELMRELGCWNALNLDGGGSAVMLLKQEVLNSPSQSQRLRPVPVMIGLRKIP